MEHLRANTHPVHERIRGTPGYPDALAALAEPPLVVRVRGRFPDDAPRVAIVGTRRADEDGLAFARTLASELSRAGLVVVSGGAVGIDAAAHRGALDVGAPTMAVLPTGFAPPYPPAHTSLFERILDGGGCLLSEMADGRPPRKWTLLRRNALVAALSDVVVVVSAPLRSGALSTASEAQAIGKIVFSVPASPWDERNEGALLLLRRGARICLDASDVLSVTAPGGGASHSDRAPSTRVPETSHDFDGDEAKVLGALGGRPRHPDEIARATGLPVERVQRALLGLLLEGRVDDRDGGRYVTAPRTR